jgi:hypothetical protein
VKKPIVLAHAFACACLALACACPAFAADEQIGRWAVDPHNCRSPGDTHASAPLTVMPMALRWADEYCTIGKMYKADNALYIEGRCSKDGLMTRRPITLAMKGARLAVTWHGEPVQEMQRCP